MRTTSSTESGTLLPKTLSIKNDIRGICEPIIYEYFRKLNNGEFAAISELFAEQGILSPPFDKQVQGRQAIAQYLEKEASGIKFLPEYGEMVKNTVVSSNLAQCDLTRHQVQGKVEIKCFTFKVSWLFEFKTVKKITLVEVKLLASLDDLLSFSHT